MEFRWNEWNLEHIAKHGVSAEEAEELIRDARPPFPEKIEDDKWLVVGKVGGGRFLQAIFVEDNDDPDCAYVLHARPLTEKEKRRLRKRLR